jgi:hypothetical protein
MNNMKMQVGLIIIYLDARMAAQQEVQICRVADLGVSNSACK